MLDQNTDRMWYVIGAVIIGAAIILILNTTFPTLFASVGETFKGKTEQTTEVVDGIMPVVREDQFVKPEDVHYTKSQLKDYDRTSRTWTLTVNPTPAGSTWHEFGGMSINTNRFVIPYGAKMVFTYEIYVPEGVTGLIATNDLNSYPVDTALPTWGGNDNHLLPDGHVRSTALTGGVWKTISFTYSNAHAGNTKEADIYEASRIGVPNTTGSPLEIKIRNVRIDVQKQVSE